MRLPQNEEDKIQPIFNRDGYYWQRQQAFAWFEYNNQAWRMDSDEQFRYEIELHLAYPTMPTREAKALLKTKHFLTKQQRQKLAHVMTRELVRQTEQSAHLARLRALKETTQEEFPVNLGCKVNVTFTNKDKVTYRNVTEIHYNYKSYISVNKIAFESDIHCNGCTWSIDSIDEFETTLEIGKAESFSETTQ
jgi:hypothetical protein